MELSAIDLADPGTYAAGVPHHWFAELRRRAPVLWHPERDGPGFWAVTRYEDCVTVNRDAGRFSSAARASFIFELPEEALDQQRLLMLNMDPPLHTRYRRMVNKAFTPRTVGRLAEGIRRDADEIIDAVVERGECDFVTDLAAELPLMVIADLLGVPRADRHLVFDWSNKMIGQHDPEYGVAPGVAEASALELYAYADRLYAEKRGRPGDDLMSALNSVEVDGERLSELELALFFLLLTVAGNETTRNLLSGGMQAFFDHPDQWAAVVDDRSLAEPAVEEMLRFVSPVMNFRRQTAAPAELSGQRIGEGEKVVFFHCSANRDDAVFSAPDRFDVRRSPNPHIAFGGGGPHHCLGASLARLEARIMLTRLAARLPDIHLAGEAQRLASPFINGVKHLPVAFTPGPLSAVPRQ